MDSKIVQDLYDKGLYKELYVKLSHFNTTIKGPVDEFINNLYLKYISMIKLEYNNEALDSINDFLLREKGNLKPLNILKMLITKIMALTQLGMGNSPVAKQTILEAVFYVKSINKTELKNLASTKKIFGHFWHEYGVYYYYQSELNDALEKYKKSLVIREKINDIRGMSDTINNMGEIYTKSGNLDLSQDCYLKCITLDESLNYFQGIAISFNNIGLLYYQKGEIEDAISHYKEALNIVKLQNKDKIKSKKHFNDDKSRIKHEIESCAHDFENLGFLTELVTNLGNAFYKKGNIDNALFYLSLALPLSTKVNNVFLSSSLLLNLINLNVDLNNTFQTDKYFLQLEKLKLDTDSIHANFHYIFAKAVLAKNKNRYKSKAEAYTLFTKIVESEDKYDWNLSVLAMIHLSELLFEEFTHFDSEIVIFEEAKTVLNKIITIAKDKTSFSLLVESFILKSKFLIIENKISKAFLLMDQAEITATEKNLTKLINKVKTERIRLESQIEGLGNLKEESLKVRLEKLKITEYLQEIRNVVKLSND